MKNIRRISLLLAAVACASMVVMAETSMSAWPFFIEVTPTATMPGIYDIVLPLHVMDKALEDLADLRLYDAGGREVPYALRIRREVDDSREVAGRMFNQASVGATASEVSVDLGDDPGEHNEIEIETEGMNFRRPVDIEGSDSGTSWKTLTSDVIYSFASRTNSVKSNRVSYPSSRYKYLRIRVFADGPREKQPPVITAVKVLMAIREKGEITSWDVAVPSYQLFRHEGAPASSWLIDLGARVPCDRLWLTVDNESFSRPFEVEVVDDPQNIRLVASGELTRRVGEKQQQLSITFDKEEYARKLRLVVNDYNNPTLSISSIRAGAPVRQLFFELKEPAPQPLRLFFGNVRADAPHYDFEKELGAKLVKPANRATIGSLIANPDYRPEPLPFTERVPWLIYVVLTISSLALAFILFSLARATMGMKPSKSSASNVHP